MATEKYESPIERMQKAGLTVEQLREIDAGQSRPEFIERVRAAGLTMAELKDIIHNSSDTHTGTGLGASVTGIGTTSPAGGISPQD